MTPINKVLLGLLASFFITLGAHAQWAGNRLKIGEVYTFESESGPGLFISAGPAEGRAKLNAPGRRFKVVAPLNGKAGFVSLQAADVPGEPYLVMAEGCPRPYTASNYYNAASKPAGEDAAFNQNASFQVLPGQSNKQDPSMVSFGCKNGTHMFKREQGVFMDAPRGGVADRYFNHFTFKLSGTVWNGETAGPDMKTQISSGSWKISDVKAEMQSGGAMSPEIQALIEQARQAFSATPKQVEFQPNGQYKATENGQVVNTGTWSVQDNIISITDATSGQVDQKKVRMSGNNLEMEVMSEGGVTIYMVLTK